MGWSAQLFHGHHCVLVHWNGILWLPQIWRLYSSLYYPQSSNRFRSIVITEVCICLKHGGPLAYMDKKNVNSQNFS